MPGDRAEDTPEAAALAKAVFSAHCGGVSQGKGGIRVERCGDGGDFGAEEEEEEEEENRKGWDVQVLRRNERR